jgi:hypothetical protein
MSPKVNIVKEQEQAVHDNISFLASMTLASTDLPNQNHVQQQQQIPSKTKSLNIQDLMNNLNEVCYKGFDELNALIQEQRWVRTTQSIYLSIIILYILGTKLYEYKFLFSNISIYSFQWFELLFITYSYCIRIFYIQM